MPFLRFSRDKRGYENTYVVHGFRSAGRSRPRILYWFRTPPPNVKIGRLPLDEEAIRDIEQNNPNLSFDWTKMLSVRSKPAKGGQPEGRSTRHKRTADIRKADVPRLSRAVANSESGAETPAASPQEPEALVGPADDDALLDHVHEDGDDQDGEGEQGWQHPVVALLGDEGLVRLRARYAELLARISEKLTDPVARSAMRARVEALNPDGWGPGEEAVVGIEQFEVEAEAVRKLLGRRRRRPRRRRRERKETEPIAEKRQPEAAEAPTISRGQTGSVGRTDDH